MSPAGFAELLQKGSELYARADYAGAAAEFAEAVKSNPLADGGYRMLAFAQYAQGLYAEAIENAEKATSLEPENPENHFAAGMALSGAQESDRAVERLEEALRLKPDHAHAKAN